MNDIILLGIGIGGALWTVGLVVVLAYFDRAQRVATATLMRDALQSIVERTGELRRVASSRQDIGTSTLQSF